MRKDVIPINSINITGRLTKDPVIKATEKSSIANITIAVDRDYKTGEERETDFFDVKVFGKRTEFIEKYIKKGTKIEVTGRLQQDKWTDKDGNKRYSVSIVADRIGFAESKSASQQNQGSSKPTESPKSDEGFLDIPSDMDAELPFA